MRKRWIGLALLFVVTLGALIGWHWQVFQWVPKAIETNLWQSQTPPERVVVPPPTVNAQRLLADLEALSVHRYTESDRDRARTYLVQALQEAGWAAQRQSYEGGVNIYAERPGTDPQAEAILVGAHYDTVARSPGADDNATGVVAALETARLLGNMPTPRPLRVAFFDQEELGLVGSFAFTEQPAFTQNLYGFLNLEMLGFACHTAQCQQYPSGLPIQPPTDRGDFLAVVGDQEHMPLIDSFTHASRPGLPAVITLPIPRRVAQWIPDLLRSDHAPFWNKGIGAVIVTDTANFRNPNYHQPTDRFDTIDPDFFVGATQLVVNATTDLLNNPDMTTPTATTQSASPRPPSGRGL